tara:strand:+ start:244 stop:942 length:699 start_codon:yes stop_codon:yes gene_type:complete
MIRIDLTIITISLNVDKSLLNTFKSIEFLLEKGVKWIVILTNKTDDLDYLNKAHLIIGKDKSLYNALNIGIDNLKTDYFMFVHSGDELINYPGFINSCNLIKNNNLDLVLGGSKIGNRIHLSKKWKPWMFMLNIQPPHLPIIYRTKFVAANRFDESIPVIADMYMLKNIFKLKPNYLHSGEVYISMEIGGLTTSGISSFFYVNKQISKANNSNIIFEHIKSIPRLILKIILK